MTKYPYQLPYVPSEEERKILQEIRESGYLPTYASILRRGIKLVYREYKTDKEADQILELAE